MQCRVAKSSVLSPDEGERVGCQVQHPVQKQQGTNILYPHQIGSIESSYSSSWPGDVWRKEAPSEFWLDSDLNNNNNNNKNSSNNKTQVALRERVSFSSDCSDSSDTSADDIFLGLDTEEGDSHRNINVVAATSASSLKLLLEDDLKQDTNNNSAAVRDANTNANNANKNNKNSNKKSEKFRLLDDEGYIRRAACVCLDETESKVLLVSSKKDPCSWLVPGGGMELGEDMATAALREAWEEAGVQGHINKYLGLFETQHQSGHKKYRTGVYVVTVNRVMADYPEAYLGRGRQWFTIEEALLHLARTRPLQSAYLQLLLVSKLKVTAT